MATRSYFLGILAVLAASGPVLAQNVSVYTDFNVTKGCVQLESNEVGGTWQCAGFGGYPVLLSEGDLRESVFYGHLGSWYSGEAWASFGPFNNAGNKIEWRLEKPDSAPFAAIQRWFTDTGDGGPKSQVLVISKVGQPGVGEACVTGYVDALANKDANAIAQKVADERARAFKCRVEEPLWHGIKGANAPSPSISYGEAAPAGAANADEAQPKP